MHTIFIYSAHKIHKLFLTSSQKFVQEQVYIKRPAKDKMKMCWKWKLNMKQRLCKNNFWNQKSRFYVVYF